MGVGGLRFCWGVEVWGVGAYLGGMSNGEWRCAVTNLVFIVLFLFGLAGPVWGQTAPDVTTPEPSGSVVPRGDLQPGECAFVDVQGHRRCVTESDLAAAARHSNPCDDPQVRRFDVNCVVAAAEDAVVYQPGRRVELKAAPDMCSLFRQMKEGGMFYSRYDLIMCVSE